MSKTISGIVASLHVHPGIAGQPLLEATEFNLVADKGVREDKRYFGRTNREGQPSKRQVTLIEREVLREHAGALGIIGEFEGGQVRSNIETNGINLISLIGQEVQVGEAILRFVEPRTPCHKMDALAQGLRELMENGRQGVIATVVKSGRVRPGDRIAAISAPESLSQSGTS